MIIIGQISIHSLTTHCDFFQFTLALLANMLLTKKWHLLSVIFLKSGLKAILMLTLFLGSCEALHKYGLFSYFDSWFSDSVFPTYSQWKSIVKTKIREFEENTWKNFVIAHPSYKLAETCLDLVSLRCFGLSVISTLI